MAFRKFGGPDWIEEDRGYKTLCLIWQRAKSKKGYGYAHRVISEKPRQYETLTAHKMIWEEEYGPVPFGFELAHKCNQRDCGELEHLLLITHADHLGLYTVVREKKTHCKWGHEYTPENTKVRNRGLYVIRSCRQCMRDSQAVSHSLEKFQLDEL